MPRTKDISAYDLHKPTGQARVRIDGNDHCLGSHGSEKLKRKYEQVLRKLITARAAEEVRARVEIATGQTISEPVAGYIQHAKVYYVKDGRQTTEFGDIARTVRPIREQFGHELVTAFGPLKLKAIREQWIAAGLVRSQVNAKVGRVRRTFAWSVEEELVPPAVLQAIKSVKDRRAPGRAASATQDEGPALATRPADREAEAAAGRAQAMVSYGDAIADAFGRAGVPRSAPNQLRYVAAATIRREFGLETAKAVLSHSTIIPTQIYAEQYLEAARCAIEKLG